MSADIHDLAARRAARDDELAQEIVIVLQRLGGSALKHDVVRIAMMRRRREGRSIPPKFANELARVFTARCLIDGAAGLEERPFWLPLGPALGRWALRIDERTGAPAPRTTQPPIWGSVGPAPIETPEVR